jgi:hypothetical protein
MIRELKGLSCSRALFLYITWVILILRCSVWFTSHIFIIAYDYLVISTLVMRMKYTYSVNMLRLILANDIIIYI